MGDTWVKERLSFIELAYRYRAEQIALANSEFPKRLAEAQMRDARPSSGLRVPGSSANAAQFLNQRMNDAFASAVRDLNERMQLAKYSLHYHNGFIQQSHDQLIGEQIAQPFWDCTADKSFTNVDAQLKEAIDRRDNRDRTAAFHAVCALESCIKIISDLKGWTNGNEKGAANYIDNIASKKNGRFIEPWEAGMLKAMFSDIRNPFAHGPGREAMPQLSPEQTNWTIETAMTWCKSLIHRLN